MQCYWCWRWAADHWSGGVVSVQRRRCPVGSRPATHVVDADSLTHHCALVNRLARPPARAVPARPQLAHLEWMDAWRVGGGFRCDPCASLAADLEDSWCELISGLGRSTQSLFTDERTRSWHAPARRVAGVTRLSQYDCDWNTRSSQHGLRTD